MWKLLLFCAIAQTAHSSCPSGFELIGINGLCGGSYVNLTLTPENALETALAKCGKMHALPVMIRNDEEQSYWRNRAGLAPSVSPLLLLGLTCNTTTQKFEWVDGSPLDYKHTPNYDFATLDEPCVYGNRFYIDSYGRWNDWNGTDNAYTVDVSCIIPLHPSTFTGCDTLEHEDGDNACYRFFESPESWQVAEKTCNKIGANLASIHNLQENSLLLRLAVSKGAASGLYLGATISGTATDLETGPMTLKRTMITLLQAFQKPDMESVSQWTLQRPPGNGLISHVIKNFHSLAFDTARPILLAAARPGGMKGQLSPDFPYSASTPCDYSLMVPENKRVELEIIHLEANSCCDYLIIYDGYLGKVLANITGDVSHKIFTTTSENIMKVSWQPKGGVGVAGLSMVFRGV